MIFEGSLWLHLPGCPSPTDSDVKRNGSATPWTSLDPSILLTSEELRTMLDAESVFGGTGHRWHYITPRDGASWKRTAQWRGSFSLSVLLITLSAAFASDFKIAKSAMGKKRWRIALDHRLAGIAGHLSRSLGLRNSGGGGRNKREVM